MIHVHAYQSRVPKEVEEEYQIHLFWKALRPRFLQTGKVFFATDKTSLLSWNWSWANGKSINMLIRSKVGNSFLQWTLPKAAYQIWLWLWLVITKRPQPGLPSIQEEVDTKWFFTAVIKLLHIIYNMVSSLDHQTLLSLSLPCTKNYHQIIFRHITAVKMFASNKGYIKTINELSRTELNSKKYKQLEEFVFCLYGRSKHKCVNTLRLDI